MNKTTKRQAAIETTAQEMRAEYIADGKPDPIGRASIGASIIADELRQDGIRAGMLFYRAVADRLIQMAIAADRSGEHRMTRLSDPVNSVAR